MSHAKDYQSTITFKNDLGLQEVYSSQNYGTFYSVYLSLESKPGSKPNQIEISNIHFKIVNYKGIINMGIVKVGVRKDETEGYLEFEVQVRAMERNREFPLVEPNGDPMEIKIDRSKINRVIITRLLLPMSTNDFNPALGPNHVNNAVFDDEFYYRDGLTFDSSDNERKKRPGMQGGGGNSSGKRCYQLTLKIED